MPGEKPWKRDREPRSVEHHGDNIVDEHQNPEETADSGKDHLRAAAGDLKEAASANIENTSSRRAKGR
jgi:hypothetical protein